MSDDHELDAMTINHPELLRETLQRELAKRGLPAYEFVGHRCAGGCDLFVARRGQYCGSCAQQQRTELRRNHQLHARASLPQWEWCRFEEAKFRACTSKAAAAACVRAAMEWRPSRGSLLLLGPTGVGKTVTAVALAYKILDRALSTTAPAELVRLATGLRFLVGLDLASARRKHPLGEGEAPAILGAQEATLLVLDEIGFESVRTPDGSPDTAVFDVLDARYRAERPVVVTSGLNRPQFTDRYGAAMMRRLKEVGQVIDMHVAPDSHGH